MYECVFMLCVQPAGYLYPAGRKEILGELLRANFRTLKPAASQERNPRLAWEVYYWYNDSAENRHRLAFEHRGGWKGARAGEFCPKQMCLVRPRFSGRWSAGGDLFYFENQKTLLLLAVFIRLKVDYFFPGELS